MAFENYKNSNNASSKLIADISASATTILITSGDEVLFPNETPFLLTIEKTNSDWFVILREIVKVTSKAQNSLTVVRWAWNCVQDDTASQRTQGNTAHSFTSWDRISLYRTSEQVKDIQDNISTNITNIWSLDTRMTTAEEDIAELQAAGKIDRLEAKVVVWERYTSSDELFIQYAPKEEDSKMALPVWDIAGRTQIHIQRVSSLTASDEAKIKMRKVWSPTTKVIVEIQKATLVNDTNEDYRYGDWTTIATAEIPYTSFSTDRQELTLTFDNEFWGGDTKELLSVIIHQEGDIVNASNYYEIACDCTQYSEWLRAVYVEDSNTRTYNKIMPYFDSDWLDRCILARQEDSLYSMPFKFPVLENMAITWNINTVKVEFAMTSHATSVQVVWHITNTQSSSTPSRYWIARIKNGNTLAELFNQSWGYDGDIDQTFTISENDSLSFEATSSYWSASWSFSNVYVYSLNWKITKSQNWALVKCFEVVNVWEETYVLITGSNGDEYFEWGIYSVEDKITLNYVAQWSNYGYAWFVAICEGIVFTDIGDSQISWLVFNWTALSSNCVISMKKGDLIYCSKSWSVSDWTNQYRVNFKFIPH